jgi:hypothetical protein
MAAHDIERIVEPSQLDIVSDGVGHRVSRPSSMR